MTRRWPTRCRRPEVDRLASNPAWQQPEPPEDPTPAASDAAATRLATALPYGLTYTRADQVWAMGYLARASWWPARNRG